MNSVKWLVALGLMVTFSAFGQDVNKCQTPDGKIVYQRSPCPGAAGTTISVQSWQESKSRKATEEEVSECLKLIKIVTSFKDPDSLRVEGGAYVVEYPSGRKDILFDLNGKNSYGAYAGPKPAYCKYKANGSVEDVKAF